MQFQLLSAYEYTLSKLHFIDFSPGQPMAIRGYMNIHDCSKKLHHFCPVDFLICCKSFMVLIKNTVIVWLAMF